MMSLFAKAAIIGILLSALYAQSAFAAAEGQGVVDWSEGYITATGYGTAPPGVYAAKGMLNAKRAAELVAQRILLETIKGVHIDSYTTVESAMLVDDVIKTRVSGFLKGAFIVKQDVKMVEGSPLATVVMKICLDGRSTDCADKPALVSELGLDRFAKGIEEAKTPYTPPPQPSQPREPAAFDNTKPVTGAIIVIGGKKYERVLLPVIVIFNAGEQALVYSVKKVAPEVIRTFGMVRYVDSLDKARGIDSAGLNPIIINANDVTPDNRIVIDKQDAGTLEETLRHGNNYLEKAKVVIVNKGHGNY